MCVSVLTKASEAQADVSSMMVKEFGAPNVGTFLTIWCSLQLSFFFFDSKRKYLIIRFVANLKLAYIALFYETVPSAIGLVQTPALVMKGLPKNSGTPYLDVTR
jgi:hypothetical protein